MKDIILSNISKSYGKKEKIEAVKNVSFEVRHGEIFGLIGPDGGGKTTLFRILTSLLLPDAGIATVRGFDVVNDYRNIRNAIGYMPGRFSLYQDLTIEENINFFATIFHTSLQENYDLIKDIYRQIEPFKKRLAGRLSGGMKQKLALCCALIHKPEVLFLDEPTTGVDVVSRKEFWDMLLNLKQHGITILVSTPYMDEVALCDTVAFIQNGSLLNINTPANYINLYPNKLFAVHSTHVFELLKCLRSCALIKTCYAFGDSLHVTIQPTSSMQQVQEFVQQNFSQEFSIHPITPSLEDCFIQLIDADSQSESLVGLADVTKINPSS